MRRWPTPFQAAQRWLAATVSEARAAIAARLPRPYRSEAVRLADVRRRLELYLTAIYDRPIAVAMAEPPRGRMRWLPRGVRGAADRLAGVEPLSTNDGERIHLPRELPASTEGKDDVLARYRLLATEQAERIARGTSAFVPGHEDRLERDLFLLREGVAVDAAVSRRVPGLRFALGAARALALHGRPSLGMLSPIERAVEMLVRRSLAADAARGASEVPADGSPAESLVWARETAAQLRGLAGRYRGVPPVTPWGVVEPRRAGGPDPSPPRADAPPTLKGSKYGFGRIGRGAQSGGNQESSEGGDEGVSDRPRAAGDASRRESGPSEPSGGAIRGTGDESADGEPESSSDAGPSSDDAAVNAAGNAHPGDHGVSRRRQARRHPARFPKPVEGGVEYPEWDWETGDYRSAGAVVRHVRPAGSDESWARGVLARHGPLVRQLRDRFDRLRARRMRLGHQRDGDELDLGACVRALVDRRTGHTVDDRFYIDVRPARRGLAIALLVDMSGSTDDWIDRRHRIIDLEKIALLIASEALDALGDLYAIVTFSGKGRDNVRVRTVKDFTEPNGPRVRERIAALEPEGYTRAGAGIRHATAILERQPAGHRLLLILSDGKPNDVDEYEGIAGIEDTRQAIIEARLRGVYPFCITIDRQGQEYLGRIFGPAGHTILRSPEQLPLSLVKVVRQLLSS